MPPSGVAERIWQFNQGRQPDMLSLKYAKLRKQAFGFFRGTAHLFYESAAPAAVVTGAPVAGLSGDLHLENFGVYRGDNGLACFDVNDFDEAFVGPVSWDLARLIASLFVGLASLDRSRAEAEALAKDFLGRYAQVLAAGGARLSDAAVLDGPIGALVRAFPSRGAPDLVDDRTNLTPSGRRLVIDHKRFLPIDHAVRDAVTQRVTDFARQHPAAGPLRVRDVARLVAGTSSLGLERYAILTEGEGTPGTPGLLELKEIAGPCAAPYLKLKQPAWPSQAERTMAAERVFQTVPPALLSAVGDAAKSFIVRDYARTRDHLALGTSGLAATVRTLAEVVARGHLRGSAVPGASGMPALQAFAQEHGWQAEFIAFAKRCAAQSHADYAEYCQAYDRGELTIP
jgi:uncharacterized protein (DUF2252 family)